MGIDRRVICSSITFRKRPLDEALSTISELGFAGIDLGALPGVCDHVPYELTAAAVDEVAACVAAHRLAVASVNGDIGDLNLDLTQTQAAARREHLDQLLSLCSAIGSPALVLPCGSQGHDPIVDLKGDIAKVGAELRAAHQVAAERDLQIWVEILHSGRLCYNIERAADLVEEFGDLPIGVVMDFSHIVASGDDPVDFVRRFGSRISHVHIRDAAPGNIHISVGRGQVDFATGLAALADAGYSGQFSLELETRDLEDSDRPAAAKAAGEYISGLLAH